jgi:hypothetical protein
MTIQQIQQLFGKPISEYALQQQQRSQTKFLVTVTILAFAVYGFYKAVEGAKNNFSGVKD